MSVRPNRRQVFLAGAVVAASTVAATESASAGGFGSGDLAPWTRLTRAISTPTTIERTRQNNGIFMFGDSLGVQDGKALAQRMLSSLNLSLAVNNWSGRPTKETVDALA